MTATVLRMARMVSIVTISSLVSWVPGTRAQEKASVQGEVVDLSCYMLTGGRGAEYQACAQLSAKKGIPFGVVTDGGELFLLVNQSADPDPYEAAKKLAGARAQVSGKTVRK